MVLPAGTPLNISPSSAASSRAVGSSGSLDLIQPVITLDFGGGSGAADIASNVVQNLANQTRQITQQVVGKDTFLGGLGIGADTILILAVTGGIALITLVLRR